MYYHTIIHYNLGNGTYSGQLPGRVSMLDAMAWCNSLGRVYKSHEYYKSK